MALLKATIILLFTVFGTVVGMTVVGMSGGSHDRATGAFVGAILALAVSAGVVSASSGSLGGPVDRFLGGEKPEDKPPPES